MVRTQIYFAGRRNRICGQIGREMREKKGSRKVRFIIQVSGVCLQKMGFTKIGIRVRDRC